VFSDRANLKQRKYRNKSMAHECEEAEVLVQQTIRWNHINASEGSATLVDDPTETSKIHTFRRKPR